MKNYGFLDVIGDDFAYGSLGPAQLKVANVKEWLPEFRSKTDDEVADMLLDPETAIDILGRCIVRKFNKFSGDIISEFRATQSVDERALLSGKMNYVKDNLGPLPYGEHPYSQEFAPRMYKNALDILWSGRIPSE